MAYILAAFWEEGGQNGQKRLRRSYNLHSRDCSTQLLRRSLQLGILAHRRRRWRTARDPLFTAHLGGKTSLFKEDPRRNNAEVPQFLNKFSVKDPRMDWRDVRVTIPSLIEKTDGGKMATFYVVTVTIGDVSYCLPICRQGFPTSHLNLPPIKRRLKPSTIEQLHTVFTPDIRRCTRFSLRSPRG